MALWRQIDRNNNPIETGRVSVKETIVGDGPVVVNDAVCLSLVKESNNRALNVGATL